MSNQPKKEAHVTHRLTEEEYMKNTYEDEDFLDEARTNEEMFDDNILQAQVLMGKMKGLENGAAFFNEDDHDDHSSNSNQSSAEDQSSQEDEEGEYNPNLHAQVLVDGDDEY